MGREMSPSSLFSFFECLMKLYKNVAIVSFFSHTRLTWQHNLVSVEMSSEMSHVKA